MNDLKSDFNSATTEARKLSITLQYFDQDIDADCQKIFTEYLRRRFRPAISQLIRTGDYIRIKKICKFAPITETALNDFISEAARIPNGELVSYFINLKNNLFGFKDNNFTI